MDHVTIHTLAASAGSDDPIQALNAIADLHRELDRVEAVTVRSARNAGASWQLIALALGVSRQAVHKKYGRA
jgi:DNA invertase Pin-like site-specific DNA recombinase